MSNRTLPANRERLNGNMIKAPDVRANIEHAVAEMRAKLTIISNVWQALEAFEDKRVSKRMLPALQTWLPGYTVTITPPDAKHRGILMQRWELFVWGKGLPFDSRITVVLAENGQGDLNPDMLYRGDDFVKLSESKEYGRYEGFAGSYFNLEESIEKYEAWLVNCDHAVFEYNKALQIFQTAVGMFQPVHHTVFEWSR